MAQAATHTQQTPLAEPKPFEAQYRFEMRGWPSATITHQFTQEGNHWLSDMSFSVTVAKGAERSRFVVNEDSVHSLIYSSSYALFGIGETYQLEEAEMLLPDRQAALFELSRQAGNQGCVITSPCEINYLDHRGREEQFVYYLVQRGPISLPAGEYDAVTVALVDAEKPDRKLQLSFHPDFPGLVLSADYRREGRRETTLSLTHFQPQGGATP
ncbi:hypothetical protein DU506_10825 [Vreelandella rituensis]|uniref:DUF3108 domain-containing protein n=1 Tax=Vreelandella rituensis TaxID=2282306 RepID=A0A368U1B5_9GAMM|nr:hypothetical protein DU506_10825 [Halomonas rituensis]